MKFLVLFTLLLTIIALSVSAFEVKMSDADGIYANESATYRVVLTNDGYVDETININFELDQRWSFETSPQIYLSQFVVQNGESVVFDIVITPTSSYISSGKYAITIPFISDRGEIVEEDVILQIKNPNALTDYLPSLNFLLDAQEGVDPRQTSKVKLEIRNRNPLDIPEMEIALTSSLYNETKTVPIEPLGSTTVVFEINYDTQQKPTDDTIVLTVTVGDKIFSPIKKDIEIIAYSDIVEYKKPAKSFFFKTTTTTEYTNKGNAEVTKQISYPTSTFAQFFTSTEPDGKIVDDDGLLYYVTSVYLPVDEPTEVVYVVNYRPIVVFILLIIIGVGAYFVFRSPVIVSKETVVLHVDKEGCMKIKVLVHIKNRSMKLIDDVEIIDKIPAVAEIEKQFEIGTMKPEKVLKHEKAGTMLVWKIHHLEAYEERIITYKVKSTYSIVGDFKLPSVTVKFRNKKNDILRVSSNKAKVGK